MEKRGIIKAEKNILEKNLLDLIKSDDKIYKHIKDKKINKVIFIPKKLINIMI